MFFFPTMFRPALGPTQPPVQWVLGFYPGVKRPGHDVGHSSPSTAEVKGEWSYASTSPYMLSWRGQGQLGGFYIIIYLLIIITI